MLMTTSAFRVASAGESSTGPTPMASALVLVRSQTETSKPAFFNRRAIAPPIFPLPSTATLVMGPSPVLVLPPSGQNVHDALTQDDADTDPEHPPPVERDTLHLGDPNRTVSHRETYDVPRACNKQG